MNAKNREIRIARHLLPTSATMIGVCMTVINIVKLIESHSQNGHADEILAVDSLFFMASAICAYISMRRGESDKVGMRYEKIADYSFLFGLVLMTVAGILITYQLV